MARRTVVRYAPIVEPQDFATPEATERIRRSLAMLATGASSGWSRETAMAILANLERLQRRELGRTCCREDDATGRTTGRERG